MDTFRNRLYLRNDLLASDSFWTTFTAPFHYGTWICMLVMMSILTVALVLTKQNGRLDQEDESGISVSDCLMTIIHGTMQQGTPEEPWKISSRIVFFSAFASSMVLYASYSASLTSFLAVKKYSLPFTDYKSFIEQSDYKIFQVPGAHYDDYYKVKRSGNNGQCKESTHLLIEWQLLDATYKRGTV